MHVGVLLILTEAVYVRPSMIAGRTRLTGADYGALHFHRIAFARDALLGHAHFLPGWYPREFLGAPFAANLQNFPWIPTRLLLFLVDPAVAYGLAVGMAAALAALFTFLFCRGAGLSHTASAVAAWTFACAGYFASRVAAGQLGLLEAYPALPLLLWLCDRALASDRQTHHRRDLLLLALACACIAVAGHPQLPVYALATAILYVLARGRGRQRVRASAAIALGVGLTLAAWYPMLLLVMRSTRALPLKPPDNDISLPYGRLAALIVPGRDGWPDLIERSRQHEFEGYPNDAYFWDTVSYIGLLPLAAMIALLIRSIRRRRIPNQPWLFLSGVGLGALVLALPIADPIRETFRLTLLRSPARLLYISTFCGAVALGCGVNSFLSSGLMKRRMLYAVAGVCLLLHGADLGRFAATFVQTAKRSRSVPPFQQLLDREVKDARVALSGDVAAEYTNRYDDAGVYDSVILAAPYRTILGLNGYAPDLNTEFLDASAFRLVALQAAGVRFVLRPDSRADLEVVDRSESLVLYRVPNPAGRADFFPHTRTEFVGFGQTLAAFLSNPTTNRLLLPKRADAYISRTHAPTEEQGRTKLVYRRPSSDNIQVEIESRERGFVEVLESYDPGWTAQVDGSPAPVLPANGFAMAVPVAAGNHTVQLAYQTPGRTAGLLLSTLDAMLLAGFLWIAGRASAL